MESQWAKIRKKWNLRKPALFTYLKGYNQRGFLYSRKAMKKNLKFLVHWWNTLKKKKIQIRVRKIIIIKSALSFSTIVQNDKNIKKKICFDNMMTIRIINVRHHELFWAKNCQKNINTFCILWKKIKDFW